RLLGPGRRRAVPGPRAVPQALGKWRERYGSAAARAHRPGARRRAPGGQPRRREGRPQRLAAEGLADPQVDDPAGMHPPLLDEVERGCGAGAGEVLEDVVPAPGGDVVELDAEAEVRPGLPFGERGHVRALLHDLDL